MVTSSIRLFYAFTFLLFANNTTFAQVPTNNVCIGAIDISTLFGQEIDLVASSELFDNTDATGEIVDPPAGLECFGDLSPLENSLWFSFVGDGNPYYIETAQCNSTNYISDGDTQMAIFSGDCNNLNPEACSDDGPSTMPGHFPAGLTLATTENVIYYILIDGFNFQGNLSVGEFCITVAQENVVGCMDMEPGVVSEYAELICWGEETEFSFSGLVFPNVEEDIVGFVWVISLGDISGSTDPASEASYVGSFPVFDQIYAPGVLNDGDPLPAGRPYYFTPVIFAGAVDTLGNNSFTGFDFSNGCATVGTSYPVMFVADTLAVETYANGATSIPYNGEAGVAIYGGSGDYNISWSNGETNDTIVGLAPGGYVVTISDNSACVDDFITTIFVDSLINTGNQDLLLADGLSLFPNPAVDKAYLNLNFTQPRDVRCFLLNNIGEILQEQRVHNATNEVVTFDLENVPEGIYMMKMVSNNTSTTKKLLVYR